MEQRWPDVARSAFDGVEAAGSPGARLPLGGGSGGLLRLLGALLRVGVDVQDGVHAGGVVALELADEAEGAGLPGGEGDAGVLAVQLVLGVRRPQPVGAALEAEVVRVVAAVVVVDVEGHAVARADEDLGVAVAADAAGGGRVAALGAAQVHGAALGAEAQEIGR